MRTDRPETAGGGTRSGGRGRTGASTTGVGTPKAKTPSPKAKKIVKEAEKAKLDSVVRYLETGKKQTAVKPKTTGYKKVVAKDVRDPGIAGNSKPGTKAHKEVFGTWTQSVEGKPKYEARVKRLQNFGKLTDRAESAAQKRIKGQVTAKPTTPKVPVKKKGK